tara:strand:+ start:154 stop:402 length:249 start_codon:yes stop_codon:yes gene_type:complete
MPFKLKYQNSDFPFKTKFDYSSKKVDYSKGGEAGKKLAVAITPNIDKDNTVWENIKGMAEVLPISRAGKYAKIIYKTITGKD